MSKPTQILVVHSSPLTREVYASALTATGLVVTTAATGRSALYSLASPDCPAPDAILSGLSLPDMAALSFLRRVRIMPRSRHVALLFLSPLATGPQATAVLSAGAQDVLSQSICISEVIARLSAYVTMADKGLFECAHQSLHRHERYRRFKAARVQRSGPSLTRFSGVLSPQSE